MNVIYVWYDKLIGTFIMIFIFWKHHDNQCANQSMLTFYSAHPRTPRDGSYIIALFN